VSLPAPTPQLTGTSFGEFAPMHTFCECDPYAALCGIPLDGSSVEPDAGDIPCLICEDLLLAPCKKCGE
tara:strand:- start:97 stop:303 length:207 start_codon:yes stop_codon:yes gene_type:complete